MSYVMFVRRTCFATTLCCAVLSPARTSLAASFSEFVDPHPAPGNQFGHTVLPLSTGNVVITSPFDDAGGTNAGAVYLFNGSSGALISTLRGSNAGDQVGFNGVTALSNGNYVLLSTSWDNGAVVNVGAATWCSGTTGVNGVVSVANSLVGSTAGDFAASGVTKLSNSNYVVRCSNWDNGAVSNVGAATWGIGTSGVSGVVSATNSLVGSTAGDQVGLSVTALWNGNYVVESENWDNGAAVNAGAATLGSGTTGVSGVVSAANSLVGSTANDAVAEAGVAALRNGNYVVRSRFWDNGSAVNAGAMTWGSGTTGVTGTVSVANSLVGSTSNDRISSSGLTTLPNGNYVVASVDWDNGAVVNVGAATWGDGMTGVTGVITAANSLVGSTASDVVGASVTALSNGNYVVGSPYWDNGAVADVGAATWGNGTTGVTGAVTAANSLIGSNANDWVGYSGVTALSNGNYVVGSPYWDNGSFVDAGAATWRSGTSGASAVISVANSLVGPGTWDLVSNDGVTALTNGNYVVASGNWSFFDLGAATWGNGTTGTTGLVSVDNSLIGSTTNDHVPNGVTALSNGNYVVNTPIWDNGGVVNAGAVTWGSGTNGVIGSISTANSLVGSTPGLQVGGGGVTALRYGDYVASTRWYNDAGAATWGGGNTGVTGVISAANSLVGASAGDSVGYGGVTALSNGHYVVRSAGWDNGAVVNAGAVTWGNATTGATGAVTTANSLVGESANTSLQPIVVDDVNETFIASFPGDGGGRVRVSPQNFENVSFVDNVASARSTIGVRPNPARGNALHVAFALPIGGPAKLELLDVSGRRVLAHDVSSLGSGQHTVNLAAGRKFAPGIYWVRLTQGASQQRTRVAVIE